MLWIFLTFLALSLTHPDVYYFIFFYMWLPRILTIAATFVVVVFVKETTVGKLYGILITIIISMSAQLNVYTIIICVARTHIHGRVDTQRHMCTQTHIHTDTLSQNYWIPICKIVSSENMQNLEQQHRNLRRIFLQCCCFFVRSLCMAESVWLVTAFCVIDFIRLNLRITDQDDHDSQHQNASKRRRRRSWISARIRRTSV